MKKTQLKYLFHTISRTKASWIAILIFFLTSSAFFLGMGWADDALCASINETFNTWNTRDVELNNYVRVTDEDIDKIQSRDEVETAEGIRFAYATFELDSSQQYSEIRQISNKVDKLELVDGVLPKESNELAIDQGCAKRGGFNVGDQITFDNDNTGTFDLEIAINETNNLADILKVKNSEHSGLEYMKNSTYTITAIVSNAAYSCTEQHTLGYNISNNKILEYMFYASPEAFKGAELGYNSVLVKGAGLSDYVYDSQEYKDKCQEVADSLSDYCEGIYKANYDKKSDVFSKLNISYEDYAYTISRTRSTLTKLVSTSIITEITSKLSWCLSLLFLVIAFLVGYITIKRLVNSQKQLIGTQKSFGFSVFDTTKMYINYVLMALVAGYALGVVAAVGIECFFVSKISAIYFLSSQVMYFDIWEVLILLACWVIIVLAITLTSVFSVCKREAVDLLNPVEKSRAKHHFYERLHIWNRLSLLNKTIIKNLSTDKRRIIGTLISTASCMALFVCAITFYYNVNHTLDKQFSDYFKFNTLVQIQDPTEDNLNIVEDILNKHQINALRIGYGDSMLETQDHKAYGTTLFIFNDKEKAKEFLVLEPYDNTSQDTYEGGHFGHAYYDYYGDDADTVNIINPDGCKYSVTPRGYFTCYLLNEIFTANKESVTDYTGFNIQENSFLVNLESISLDELKDILKNSDVSLTCKDYIAIAKSYSNTFVIVVDTVALIYIVTAIVMAFLVLLNILAQFIFEKRNEIIIMQINGYSERDVKRYVFSDTMLLTLLGLVPGGVIGSICGYFAVCSFDSPSTSLLKDFVWISWVIGAIATLVLSCICCFITLRKIKNLNISNIE